MCQAAHGARKYALGLFLIHATVHLVSLKKIKTGEPHTNTPKHIVEVWRPWSNVQLHTLSDVHFNAQLLLLMTLMDFTKR